MVLEHRDCERDLVAATHVCKYWRSTLISNPSLWNHVTVPSGRGLDGTLTYLKRSGSTPIDVHVNMRSPRGYKVLEGLVPHIPRTRSLTVDGTKNGILAASPLLLNPTQSLQRLELRSRGVAELPGDFLGEQLSSLRSITFHGVFPTLGSSFPSSNLTEFRFLLDPHGRAFPVGRRRLFRFLSGCPQLQKIRIELSLIIYTDDVFDGTILLESVTELDYTCAVVFKVLPYLEFPRLKRLQTTAPSRMGRVDQIAGFLPYNGPAFLAGVTRMSYYASQYRSTRLSVDGVDVSLTTCSFPSPIGWFSDRPSIPFGQIEDLTVKGYSTAQDSPILPIDLFENLRVLRVSPKDILFAGAVFRLLFPRAQIPCPTLREIWYTKDHETLEPLVDLARSRLQAGHRLGSVRLFQVGESDKDDVRKLREFVGEVIVQEKET